MDLTAETNEHGNGIHVEDIFFRKIYERKIKIAWLIVLSASTVYTYISLKWKINVILVGSTEISIFFTPISLPVETA